MATKSKKLATAQKSPLSRERLIEAALDALQENGLGGVSTRNIAERLQVQSPALYWHVRNKDELLQMVADAICGQMDFPDRMRSPRERLETIAHEYRRVLLAHRDAARLFAEQPPTGPNRIRLYELAVGAFVDEGFSSTDAVTMATFYRHYLLGMITEEAREQAHGKREAPVSAYALGVELSTLDQASADYPHLAGAANALTTIDPDRLFDVGMKILLDGVQAQRHAKKGKGSAQRP